MAARTIKANKRRRRTAEEQIADLEAEIERLRARARSLDKFSPEALKEERERLQLTAADYGKLLGVSPLTVYSWEHGRNSPRSRQLEAWLAVRGISEREAHRRLGIDKPRSGFSPEAVLAERERLELSAADYGELLGVSSLTIYNWEKGKSHPREKQERAWLELKGIGKRKAWQLLGY